MINKLYKKILQGENITKTQALELINEPLDELLSVANEIRQHFCGNIFDVCSITNAKSGRCSEDCKFCAQSAHFKTNIKTYPLIDADTILSSAMHSASKGVLRFSLVTSGKGLNDKEVDKVIYAINEIKKYSDIQICSSLGLLSNENFKKLLNVGVKRIHNNIETSRNFFPNICSTHSYDDKINAIKLAQNLGFEICSGGIIGLGESMEDRIDMAFELRNLNIKSIPINILSPIKATPFENNKPLETNEILRTCALFRFILPDAFIRLAGGRISLDDKGYKAFKSGVNAVITGDMLTTQGISIDHDMKMINDLGYKVQLPV